MKVFAALVTLGGLVVSASAQYAIAPDSVSLKTRKLWCTQQTTQCPLICLQTKAASSVTEQNECDAHSLTYSCLCANGLTPNLTEYSQTLPYFICTEWGTQCVSNCGENNLCAASCRQDHPCGAQSPRKPNTSTITTATTLHATAKKGHVTTTSGSGGTVCTGFGAGACGQATSTAGVSVDESGQGSGAARSLSVFHESSQTVGLVFLVGAFFLGFALVL